MFGVSGGVLHSDPARGDGARVPAPAHRSANIDGTGGERLVLENVGNVAIASGHLIFMRESTLFAQPFDPEQVTLSGEPFPLEVDAHARILLVAAREEEAKVLRHAARLLEAAAES